MVKAVGYELPSAGANLHSDEDRLALGIQSQPNGTAFSSRIFTGLAARVMRRLGAAFVVRPPSLVIFTPLAVAATLFISLVIGLTAAQVSGDMPGSFGIVLLVFASLPISLFTTIFLSIVMPSRAYASSSPAKAFLSSYCPYVLGSAAGIWGAIWLGTLLPLDYEPLPNVWTAAIGVGGPLTWLLLGMVSNHLAATAERRREIEQGLDELRESRHRLMVVHEQTKKEVAGLLHGRVQGRMIVLGHWLRECQESLRENPSEAAEGLERVSKLLQEIRDQELRSITRQLYPSITRTGLPSAVNSLADRFRSMLSVDVIIDSSISKLDSPLHQGLNESTRLVVYRVAEEALGNVAKHSGAQKARINLGLSETAQEVVLEIWDNGRGFDQSQTGPGHGLLTMEDYVVPLGGSVTVRSSVGMGTSVKAWVPVHSARVPQEAWVSHLKDLHMEAYQQPDAPTNGAEEPRVLSDTVLTTATAD